LRYYERRQLHWGESTKLLQPRTNDEPTPRLEIARITSTAVHHGIANELARDSRRFAARGREALRVRCVMTIILFIIVVLVVLALAIYLVDLLPIPNGTIKRLIQALCVLAALIVILNRTGLVRV
jgi:hypothetical protein